MKNPKWAYYGILVAVWVAYAVLMVLAPINTAAMERYHMTILQLRLLQVGIALPLLFIWWTLVYGIAHVHGYVLSLGQATEAKAYRLLQYGLLALLIGLIVPSFINFLQSYKLLEPEQLSPVTRSLNILVMLVAGITIWKAGKLLTTKLDAKIQQCYMLVAAVAAVMCTLVIGYFILQNPYRSVSSDPLIHPAYAGMSDAMIVLTSVIPYGVAWLFGFLAFGALFVYQKYSGGILYRQAFKLLGNGILTVILFSVIMQMLSTAQSFFAGVSLAVLVGIIYLILLVMMVAYLLIARGAKQLTKIETV